MVAKLKQFILISFFAGIFLLTLFACGGAYWSHQLLDSPLDIGDEPVLLEIKPGMHAKTVLQQLKQQEIWPHSSELSYVASRLWANPERMQAGVYQLQYGQTLRQFWQQLQAGRQHQFAVTLVEGQTLMQWLEIIGAHDYLQPLTSSPSELLKQVASDASWPSLEGLLAPDTYHFYAGTSALKILRKAYKTQQQRLYGVWEDRADELPYTEPYELLIMASIIEKETGLTGERDKVSSVFVNRLRKGMRLQSDPTTIYGIADFDGNLTRAHLREETAYNTYRIDGLPPTPIAMPSLASLRAAAHPATTDYFYFVADGSGGHVFSRTLEEHNKAVNRYQRGMN
ncbi:endolytic transglycosylase MltG [Pseudidiomarina homiensis]|uniref:Endolytic murein transglycosylase n=1 Tax=Pseudidiomarina homiensis TaxID=364198 RepID=A0A432Y471_9GAMM|nr:endolytic transglycosylase MltG [Pseudidiomarina homiensis]